MAIFPIKKFLHDNFIIRSAVLADAARLIAHTSRIAIEDSRTILTSREEMARITIDQEENWIRSYLEHPHKLILVAENKEEQIIGVLDVATGSYARNQHIAKIGMAVRKEFRQQGVGSALLQTVISWAKNIPVLEKIELQVQVSNIPAIHLYQKTGFQTEHTSYKAVKYGPADYSDLITMGLWIK